MNHDPKNLMYCFLTIALCVSCGNGRINLSDKVELSHDSIKTNPRENYFVPGNTVKTRYEVPRGFHRVETEKGSFEEFLQNLPLKPQDYITHLYDGREKDAQVATSVIDLDFDSINLQHSADAIIRLRAEYLYRTKQYDKIHFNFSNGFRCDYLKWAQGFRIKVNGNRVRWHKAYDEEDFSYPVFREYLLQIFKYADSTSLAREMENTQEDEFGIGSVIMARGVMATL